jgi:hypothetical protein
MDCLEHRVASRIGWSSRLILGRYALSLSVSITPENGISRDDAHSEVDGTTAFGSAFSRFGYAGTPNPGEDSP